jgi:enterochelin esterase-like enzyme
MRALALGCAALVLLIEVVLIPGSPSARGATPGSGAAPVDLPQSFQQIDQGPAGGTVWQGLIPDPAVPAARRLTIVYLPPGVSPTGRYPVLYLLHGFRGSPYVYPFGLRFATVADRAIESNAVRPFIAVAPPAGVTARFDGEWTGVWENYVVQNVVPWVDSHLPVLRARQGRAIAGLSAGGYGAVDIGLRHPDLFQTLESWSGYFRPFRDGSLAHAGPAALAAHDPSDLVEAEARQLRRFGTRFFLSSGTTHDRTSADDAVEFAGELASLRLTYQLFLRPGGHDGIFWRAQLPAALRFALATTRPI